MAQRSAPQIPLIPIELPPQPLSPWLRLAHRTVIGPEGSGRGILRSCDDYMLMLQLEGTGFIYWHELQGSVALPPGAVAFVPPHRVHAWGVCPGAHIAVHFDLHAQPGIDAQSMLHHHEQTVAPAPLPAMPHFAVRVPGENETLRIPLVTSLRRPAAFRERLEPLVAMYGARSHHGLAARLRAAAILPAALEMLHVPGERAATGIDPRILRLLTELDAQCARPWAIGALARRVQMGPTAFRQAFRAATGASPQQHLERLRLDRARRMLIDTDLSIAAIAAAVGFPDPYHFSRVFRRVTGAAPRSARGR